MRKEIKIGHTNQLKYVEDNKFILEKTFNDFNHEIDYSVLKEFDFVPQLFENQANKVIWEFIDGQMLFQPTSNDIKELATILRKLHKSDAKFPKNNIRKRITKYLKIIHDKKIHSEAIESYYREGLKIIKNMNMINPVHNDVWFENIIKSKNGKLFLVDWEYATMGDKHFDLAFYIQSAKLNKEQEELFLSTYNSYDDYQAYDEKLIKMYKRFVNYITICWAYAQDKMPFDISNLETQLLKKE